MGIPIYVHSTDYTKTTEDLSITNKKYWLLAVVEDVLLPGANFGL